MASRWTDRKMENADRCGSDGKWKGGGGGSGIVWNEAELGNVIVIGTRDVIWKTKLLCTVKIE